MPTGSNSLQESVQGVVDALVPAEVRGLGARQVLVAVILLVICLIVIRILMSILNRFLKRSKIEKTLHSFIRSIVRVLLCFLAVLIVVSSLGVNITSLIALFSVVGLALSLALQGTLSNLAGGIMLLATKPFLVGDFVEIGSDTGTVLEINLVYTCLNTVDNKRVSIPNSEVSSGRVINYSAEPNRRVEITVSASYDAGVDEVKQALREAVERQELVLKEPAAFIRLNAYGDSAIEYVVRVWCATEDYWTVYFDLMEEVKRSFDRHQIEMTYPHLNVHLDEQK